MSSECHEQYCCRHLTAMIGFCYFPPPQYRMEVRLLASGGNRSHSLQTILFLIEFRHAEEKIIQFRHFERINKRQGCRNLQFLLGSRAPKRSNLCATTASSPRIAQPSVLLLNTVHSPSTLHPEPGPTPPNPSSMVDHFRSSLWGEVASSGRLEQRRSALHCLSRHCRRHLGWV